MNRFVLIALAFLSVTACGRFHEVARLSGDSRMARPYMICDGKVGRETHRFWIYKTKTTLDDLWLEFDGTVRVEVISEAGRSTLSESYPASARENSDSFSYAFSAIFGDAGQKIKVSIESDFERKPGETLAGNVQGYASPYDFPVLCKKSGKNR